MKKFIFATLLVASLFGISSVLSAQENKTGSVQGSIYQDTNGDGLCQDGTPLAGVSVTLQLDGTTLKAISAENGSYFVNVPTQGSWRVNAFSANQRWGVVSAHPLNLDVSATGNLSQTGANFCMQRATDNGNVLTNQGAIISLPPVPVGGDNVVSSSSPSLPEQSAALLTSPPESVQPEPEKLVQIQQETLEDKAIPVDQWLDYLNTFRQMAGVPLVAEDSDLTFGAHSHSRYMVVHDRPIAHAEDAKFALYSPAGHKAGANGLIFATSQIQADHIWAFNFFVSAPFHLIPLIDPNLETVGYGHYNENVGNFKMAGVLDVRSGLQYPPKDEINYPIKFPGNGEETWVLRHSLFEWPNAMPSCPGYSRPSGPPIVLILGSGDLTPQVSRFGLMENGKPLEVCMFHESNYSNPNATEQSVGRTILGSRDAIVLIPRNPLITNSEYAVEIETNGELHAWSFTTRAGP